MRSSRQREFHTKQSTAVKNTVLLKHNGKIEKEKLNEDYNQLSETLQQHPSPAGVYRQNTLYQFDKYRNECRFLNIRN